MSTDQNAPAEQPGSAVPPQEPAWGAEQPPAANRPGWSGRKTVAAVAIAVGIAAAGGTAIYAANGAVGASEMGPGGRGGPGGYGRMGGGFAGGGTLGGFGTSLHGEFQVGTVTDVSSSSIGVKSTDGYTKTYTIDSTTVIGGGGRMDQQTKGDVSSLANGDTVTVIGETADGKTTAKSILERVEGQQGQQGQMPGGQQPPGVQPRREDQGSGQPPTS
ncbi:DUF5666 domain-containing protein [Umezawaea sp. Da 62-37]|uniref:DUF5666 domain-containing protein n=1 Tax=Umezawaea sp. Da 62-37 TaxID=3075927 RepID=UPI0028F716E5|nr:DUF5666 domain-containing protein [Umezawaea sp. Da 62-37]WNV89229.1 DUF5666 domain-containing protein [Umezawaea sp. Da 62-37]